MLQRPAVARAKLSKILASLRQTQRAVRAASHFIGICIILAVILPKAHGTNLEAAATTQGQIAAAWATISWALFGWPVYVLKSHNSGRSNLGGADWKL